MVEKRKGNRWSLARARIYDNLLWKFFIEIGAPQNLDRANFSNEARVHNLNWLVNY